MHSPTSCRASSRPAGSKARVARGHKHIDAMLIYIFRRLLVALSVMLTVAVVSFMLLHLSGDLATAIAGPESTAADVEKIRVQYGLDRPITAQFFDWLGAAAQLDFGRSFYFQNTVVELIGERLPITLKLGGVALLLAV